MFAVPKVLSILDLLALGGPPEAHFAPVPQLLAHSRFPARSAQRPLIYQAFSTTRSVGPA